MKQKLRQLKKKKQKKKKLCRVADVVEVNLSKHVKLLPDWYLVDS